jgi:hypothetical protein
LNLQFIFMKRMHRCFVVQQQFPRLRLPSHFLACINWGSTRTYGQKADNGIPVLLESNPSSLAAESVGKPSVPGPSRKHRTFVDGYPD